MLHAIQHILGICGDSPSHVSIVGLMAGMDSIPWIGFCSAFLREKLRRKK